MGFADLLRQSLDHILRERLMARHYQARQVEWVARSASRFRYYAVRCCRCVDRGHNLAVASIHLTNGELDTETRGTDGPAGPGTTGQFAQGHGQAFGLLTSSEHDVSPGFPCVWSAAAWQNFLSNGNMITDEEDNSFSGEGKVNSESRIQDGSSCWVC